MPATLTDVAQAAGVSIATASRVLSRSDHPVNEKTRRRVLVAARELDYRPNLIARSLRTDRTLSIGIIVEDISNFFSSRIVRGILDALKVCGYLGTIISTDYDAQAEAEATQALVQRHADGIIFVDTALHVVEAPLIAPQVPTTYVNRRSLQGDSTCVVPDNRYAGRLAVEHLIGLGHRRIAYIDGPKEWIASEERYAGYRDALENHDLPVHPELVAAGNWQQSGGIEAVRRFMALDDSPTALFASSDLMALGAIHALHKAHRRVPEDIAVVGHDNREFTELTHPEITTVELPGYAMGQQATELLLREIEEGGARRQVVAVRGELIVRASCGQACDPAWAPGPQSKQTTSEGGYRAN